MQPQTKSSNREEHLDIVESLIGGGVRSVYSKRLCCTNNKVLPDYKTENISSFIIMVDAKNLYAGIMKKFALPLHDFEIFDKTEWTNELAEENLRELLNTLDYDEVGFIVEVNFSYPHSMHDLHSDFHLALSKMVDECWLSEYQSSLLADMQIKKTRR